MTTDAEFLANIKANGIDSDEELERLTRLLDKEKNTGPEYTVMVPTETGLKRVIDCTVEDLRYAAAYHHRLADDLLKAADKK